MVATVQRKMMNVVTLMPPPAPPGAAPMNMRISAKNRVTSRVASMGMMVNPHVRGVTAWKNVTASFSLSGIPASVWLCSAR